MGAAALVVMSAEKAEELGLEPLFEIVSYASGGVDPKIMGTGPIPATRKALEKANLKVEDLETHRSQRSLCFTSTFCCNGSQI